MKNKKIFIHLGYPKTASTFLQNEIFINLNDTFFIDKMSNEQRYRKVIQPIIDSSPEFFYSKSTTILEYLGNQKEKNVFISDESFIFGRDKFYPNNYETIVQRINKLFPEATYIVSIRNQADFIKSYYSQLKKKNFFLNNFNHWLECEKKKLSLKNGIIPKIEYFEVLQVIHKHILKDNTNIIQYENLSEKTIRELLEIKLKLKINKANFNIKLNERSSILNVFGLYLYNNFLKNLLNNNIKDFLKSKKLFFEKLGPKQKIEYSKENLKFIKEYFKTSNKNLENEYNLKLNEKFYH